MEEFASEASAVTVVVLFLGFLRWAVVQLRETMKDFSETVEKSIRANTDVTNATYEYLKKRNGSLEANQFIVIKALEKITENINEKH